MVWVFDVFTSITVNSIFENTNEKTWAVGKASNLVAARGTYRVEFLERGLENRFYGNRRKTPNNEITEKLVIKKLCISI